MGKMTARRMKVSPHFDLIYYMELAGQQRVEHALLAKLQERWNRWRDQGLHAWKLLPEFATGDQGYLLVWLDKAVEDEVEDAWQESPMVGMAVHNLAICLAMSAAHSSSPELLAGACAPLPRPDKDMRAQFKRLGLEWIAEENRVDRTYAVLTPHPYAGGCEICLSKDICVNSAVRHDPEPQAPRPE